MIKLGERIKNIRKQLKLNQADFALKIGLESPMAISAYENNQTEPDISKLVKISELGNVSLDELLTGEGEKFISKTPSVGIKDKAKADENHVDDFITIPRFSDKISAGGGLVPVNNVEIRVAFRKDWIQRKGDPNRMSLIAVSGDSMEPTLMSRDLVLINHAHNYLDPQGGIYAIALGEVILIKRLQILYPSGKVRIISDNEKYDSFDLSHEEVKINGRVIWFGREV